MKKEIAADAKLSGTQKACLIIFAAAFVVMVIGFIPWGSFGITAFEGWSAFFTGLPLGEWYFQGGHHMVPVPLPFSSASWAS